MDNLAVDLVKWWKLDSLAGEGIANFLNLLADMVTVPKDNDVDRSFSLVCLRGLIITKVGEFLYKQIRLSLG